MNKNDEEMQFQQIQGLVLVSPHFWQLIQILVQGNTSWHVTGSYDWYLLVENSSSYNNNQKCGVRQGQRAHGKGFFEYFEP